MSYYSDVEYQPEDEMEEKQPKESKVGLAGLKPAQRRRISPRTEVVRSFSYKLNLGNYQSADLFCSQKSECAVEDADVVSDAIYQFAKGEVMRAVKQMRAEMFTEVPK